MEANTNCYYCSKYAEIIDDYPVNISTFSLEDDTSRCQLHAQYVCSSCDTPNHFNGITYCHKCHVYTCLRCSNKKPGIEMCDFLIYTYYYAIACNVCNEELPALDYAEYTLNHPMQTGVIRPESLNLWVPLGDNLTSSEFTGSMRISNLASNNCIRLDEYDDDIVEKTWTDLTESWIAGSEGGDPHHEVIILPALLSLIEFKDDDVVLDIACGFGNLTRKIAPYVGKITGLDIAKPMIDYAIKVEKKLQQGIAYLHQSAENIESLNLESFDIITCNMALMDMSGLEPVLKNIYQLLKKNGKFVFSITHPCFSWPVFNTVKLPHDSERNEDKTSILLNYFDSRPVRIEIPSVPSPLLHFPRTLSTYVNSLISHGFTIKQIVEPEVDEKTAMKYPRDFYNDHTEFPNFMVILVEK